MIPASGRSSCQSLVVCIDFYTDFGPGTTSSSLWRISYRVVSLTNVAATYLSTNPRRRVECSTVKSASPLFNLTVRLSL